MTITDTRCRACGSDLVLRIASEWLCAACLLHALDRAHHDLDGVRDGTGCDEMIRVGEEDIDDLRFELERFIRYWPNGQHHRIPHHSSRTATFIYILLFLIAIAAMIMGIVTS